MRLVWCDLSGGDVRKLLIRALLQPALSLKRLSSSLRERLSPRSLKRPLSGLFRTSSNPSPPPKRRIAIKILGAQPVGTRRAHGLGLPAVSSPAPERCRGVDPASLPCDATRRVTQSAPTSSRLPSTPTFDPHGNGADSSSIPSLPFGRTSHSRAHSTASAFPFEFVPDWDPFARPPPPPLCTPERQGRLYRPGPRPQKVPTAASPWSNSSLHAMPSDRDSGYWSSSSSSNAPSTRASMDCPPSPRTRSSYARSALSPLDEEAPAPSKSAPPFIRSVSSALLALDELIDDLAEMVDSQEKSATNW